jgi:hypothetical protein
MDIYKDNVSVENGSTVKYRHVVYLFMAYLTTENTAKCLTVLIRM